MSLFTIALRSLVYFWRGNLALAAGVAAATAVLTGALIVGDSMRDSLRSLSLDRLGQIDELLVSDGFFQSALAEKLQQTPIFQEQYSKAIPIILFPGGTVQSNSNGESCNVAGNVSVFGIQPEFWSLNRDDSSMAKKPAPSFPNPNSVIINQSLADDLRIGSMDDVPDMRLTVRIPKRNQLPGDSPMSKKSELIESLVDLEIASIVPDQGLGRFGMHPTQSNPLNIYVPIELLQDALSRTVLRHKSDPDQTNTILLSRKNGTTPDTVDSEKLLKQVQPDLADFGLSLKRITRTFGEAENKQTVFDYWSLSSDRLVFTDEEAAVIQSALPNAKPVFTYLANDIRKGDEESGIPFSMVSAIKFDESFQPTSVENDQPLKPLEKDQIVLNEWAAEDLKANIDDDSIVVTYFEPETSHGEQTERSVTLELVGIARFAEPIDAWRVPRRGPLIPARYEDRPYVTNDPFLTPEVPGLTDSRTIENWDLPFDTAGKINSEDDEYWSNHRTTPKAFVSLETGRQLWGSRFGQTTSFRIPVAAGDREAVAERLRSAVATTDVNFGLRIVPIKQRALKASSGSTPFDVLFLALSMFVIAAALILVSLLFRLSFQQRASQVGVMLATGFNLSRLRKIWLTEMLGVSLVGSALGVMLGLGYAALMIQGLSSWWLGAISQPFLKLHVQPETLVVGLGSGLVICLATIFWSLRKTIRRSVRELLGGQIETVSMRSGEQRSSNRTWLAWGLVVAATGLAVGAARLSGETQAGAFMGAGFLVLTALLMFVLRWFRRPNAESKHTLSLGTLAANNGKRNPMRSTLTIGLVAVASFLIVAVSAFRLAPTEQGTGGYDWLARSSQPILEDIFTSSARAKSLGEENRLTPGTVVMPLRYKSGEDASCNNLYQSTQPQVLGVTPAFIREFDPPEPSGFESQTLHSFAWAGNIASTESEMQNPWRLLESSVVHAGTEDDPIPVVIDKNTANYSLKIFAVDAPLVVDYDSGETIYFRVVGFLSNTILQGNLIISESDFEQAFPSISGYQVFLIRDGESASSNETSEQKSSAQILENRLSDYGFDARSTTEVLSGFMAVQNTYLSAFQSLGALGLLLGTFGLAAIQWRNVLERRKELGLLQAVGFGRPRLRWMLLLENGFLLLVGLGVGISAALFTTLPHAWFGNVSVPWGPLVMMFGVIAVVGLLASGWAARQVFRLPLLESLRSDR